MVYYNKKKLFNSNNIENPTLIKSVIGGAVKSVNLENIIIDKEKQKNIYIDNKISDEKLQKFINLKLN